MYLKRVLCCFITAQKRGDSSREQVSSNAGFTLCIDGKVLDITSLNNNHKWRGRGNKEGAVAAIKELEKAGLGVVIEEKCSRGATKVLGEN